MVRSAVLDGPHYPIRVEPKHAELAMTALRYYERNGPNESAFDQIWEKSDLESARKAFAEIKGDDPNTWQTVPLTPAEYDGFEGAHVEYQLEAVGRSEPEGWDELTDEVHYWHDRDPIESDLSASEYVDILETIADNYANWRVEYGPDADTSADRTDAKLELTITEQGNMGGSEYATARLLVKTNDRGTRTYEVHAFAAVGKNIQNAHSGQTENFSDELIDAQIGKHYHRHSAAREISAFLEHAETNGPDWIAEPATDDDGPTDADDADDDGGTHGIEFGSMSAANAARRNYSEYVCGIDDDRRFKEVWFVSDTPENVLEQIRIDADDSHGTSSEGAGQAELTDKERDKIDFTESNVPRAMSHKAVFLDEGVGSWLDYWSEDLTTIGEAREAAKRAKQDQQGSKRIDEPEEDYEEKAANAAQKVQKEGCDHGRKKCKHGDPEACEYLKNECGYEENEVEQLLGSIEPQESADETTEQTELVTVGGDEYPEMEVSPAVAGALNRSWQGYKTAIGEIEDTAKAVMNAKQSFAAINAIRRNHGQDEIQPEKLNAILSRLDDLPEVTTLDEFEDEPAKPDSDDGPNLSKAPAPENYDEPRSFDTRVDDDPDLSKEPRAENYDTPRTIDAESPQQVGTLELPATVGRFEPVESNTGSATWETPEGHKVHISKRGTRDGGHNDRNWTVNLHEPGDGRTLSESFYSGNEAKEQAIDWMQDPDLYLDSAPPEKWYVLDRNDPENHTEGPETKEKAMERAKFLDHRKSGDFGITTTPEDYENADPDLSKEPASERADPIRTIDPNNADTEGTIYDDAKQELRAALAHYEPDDWPRVEGYRLHNTQAHVVFHLTDNHDGLRVNFDSRSYRWVTTYYGPDYGRQHTRWADSAREALEHAREATHRLAEGKEKAHPPSDGPPKHLDLDDDPDPDLSKAPRSEDYATTRSVVENQPQATSAYYPERIGPTVLIRALATLTATYQGPDGAEFAIGKESTGGGQGHWIKVVQEDTRSGGYRDYSPADRDEAIDLLRGRIAEHYGLDPADVTTEWGPERDDLQDSPDVGDVGVWEYEGSEVGDSGFRFQWRNERGTMEGGTQMVTVSRRGDHQGPWDVVIGNTDRLERATLAEADRRREALSIGQSYVEEHPEGFPADEIARLAQTGPDLSKAPRSENYDTPRTIDAESDGTPLTAVPGIGENTANEIRRITAGDITTAGELAEDWELQAGDVVNDPTFQAVPAAHRERAIEYLPANIHNPYETADPDLSKAPRSENYDTPRTIDAPESPAFTPEKQGTLGTGVEPTETAEERQVTLTGGDDGESETAPAAWRTTGTSAGFDGPTKWTGGPYQVKVGGSDPYNVVLYGPDDNFTVASGVRTADRAQQIADEFTDRIQPDEVSFHSGNSVAPEAAAEAKTAATDDEGGILEY